MEANVPGAQPPASALQQQPAYGDAEHQPRIDGRDYGGEETEVSPVGSISRLIHLAGTLLVVGVVAVGQVVWVALLGYGLYWVAARLPL